jgi:hypothetical protein
VMVVYQRSPRSCIPTTVTAVRRCFCARFRFCFRWSSSRFRFDCSNRPPTKFIILIYFIRSFSILPRASLICVTTSSAEELSYIWKK